VTVYRIKTAKHSVHQYLVYTHQVMINIAKFQKEFWPSSPNVFTCRLGVYWKYTSFTILMLLSQISLVMEIYNFNALTITKTHLLLKILISVIMHSTLNY